MPIRPENRDRTAQQTRTKALEAQMEPMF